MDKRLSSPSNPSGAALSLPSSEPSSSRSPLQASQRPSSSSSTSTKSSAAEANNQRLSMQSPQMRRTSTIPRPAPIPIPEPVSIPNADTTGSSGEGPSSTSSTNSALASVSAELIQHISTGLHSHSSSLSPTSPKETNNLLGEGSETPRSMSSQRPLPNTPRPRSAVETNSTSNLPGGLGHGIQYDAIHNRPHSSADQWGVRPPSVHSANEGTHQNPGSRSHSPSADSMLRVSSVPRSRSSNFINTPSPLNPNALPTPRRPGSTISRPPSMVLYRLAGVGDDFNPQMTSLSPPVTTNSRRASRFSTLSSTGSSVFGDSKYPVPAGEDGTLTPPPSGAFLAYEYDPSLDLEAPDDAEDMLHTPDPPGKKEPIGSFTVRGFCNMFVIILIPLVLIVLFLLYPLISYYDSGGRSSFLTGTNSGNNPQGGNNPTVSTTRGPNDLIDPDTPESAKTWSNAGGDSYKLVFSDEFKLDDRSFGAQQDPFWEAVELHDAKNLDLNYFQPEQVTTQGGHLVITMEQRSTNGLDYVSGMLQSWNKFCFTGGYIEVAVSLPGTGTVTGFNSQVYTMGNLARSGYRASEEGVYPFSYDACDEAAQVMQNGGGELSTLPAQRLSACTCPAERRRGNHPGPLNDQTLRGRGSPHIDILGNAFDTGETGIVSQGFRIAPMNPDRLVHNGQSIQSSSNARLSTYHGNDKAQVISALTNVPPGSYSSGGAQFTAFGYEHVPNADDQSQAALHFFRGGNSEMYRVTGASVPAGDAGLSQRLISNEPMYVVLGLALSQAIAGIDPNQLTFPAKMLVDYVRVYQRDGEDSKVTCDPTDFPTKDYIDKHSRAYSDASLDSWAAAGFDAPGSTWLGTC